MRDPTKSVIDQRRVALGSVISGEIVPLHRLGGNPGFTVPKPPYLCKLLK